MLLRAMLLSSALAASCSTYAAQIQYKRITWEHPEYRVGGKALSQREIKGTQLYRDGKKIGGILPYQINTWAIILPAAGCSKIQATTIDVNGAESRQSNAIFVCASS